MHQPAPITDQAVKREVYTSTVKAHIITIWVGVLINVVWFASDYFTNNEHFIPFLIFRSSVSLISILLLLFRKALKLDVYTCLFVFVLGVSIENSFMWSVMDAVHFQQHATAYIVLFIGVGMLVLWDLKFSLLLLFASMISSLAFYKANSTLTPDQFLVNGGLLTLTIAVFSVFMVRTRYRLTSSEIRNRMELAQSKEIIEQKHSEVLHQKAELQEKNQEITDSINYARNIQAALIPSEKSFNDKFKDSFVLFKPKDIVSGDFYWLYEKNNHIFYATADCTGHGVPGGFMTMLGLSFLEEIIAGQNVSDPAEVLNLMRDRIMAALNQTGQIGENKDGMDITICRLEKNGNELVFASANNSLYIVGTDRQLTEYKGDKQPCGFSIVHKPFTAHTIQLNAGDCIYTFTDGYADQFGGPKGKKFRYKQLEELLQGNSHLSFSDQKQRLNTANVDWRGNLDQVDDILVIGVKI